MNVVCFFCPQAVNMIISIQWIGTVHVHSFLLKMKQNTNADVIIALPIIIFAVIYSQMIHSDWYLLVLGLKILTKS